MSNYFGFEYFCGANVLIRIGRMPLLEATGLSLSMQESKRPIYGYSSRHFDAVASGQVIVQGQLIINYVHQDYLFHAISSGVGNSTARSTPTVIAAGNVEADPMTSTQYYDEASIIQANKSRWWANNDSSTKRMLNPTRNPHDDLSSIDIRVTFGDQDLGFKDNGRTGMYIQNVHFLGRSSVISISEDVIVEAYPFLARNIQSLKSTS